MWRDHSIAFAGVDYVTQIAFDQGQHNPSLSPDDLTMFFTRDNPTTGGVDLYFTRRSAVGALWSSPQPESELNGAFYNGRLALAGNQTIGVCVSFQPSQRGSSFSGGAKP